MKITIKRGGKTISRKKAAEWIGEARLDARIREAKEAYRHDPLEEISWMDGMQIIIK